jgi:hypothetical protein
MKSSHVFFLAALLLACAAWFAGDLFHQSQLWPDMIICLVFFFVGATINFRFFSKQRLDLSWLLFTGGQVVIWLTFHAGITLLHQKQHVYHQVFPAIIDALAITAFLSLFLLERERKVNHLSNS